MSKRTAGLSLQVPVVELPEVLQVQQLIKVNLNRRVFLEMGSGKIHNSGRKPGSVSTVRRWGI